MNLTTMVIALGMNIALLVLVLLTTDRNVASDIGMPHDGDVGLGEG